MRQLLGLATLMLAGLLAAHPAAASEEDIAAWRTFTVACDAAAPFGRTTVAVTTGDTKSGVAELKVTTAAFAVAVDVPAAVFDGQPRPDLGSLMVSSEPGYDPHPWLYVSFALTTRPPEPGQFRPRLYVAVQNGKVVKRFLKTWADGGPKYQDLPMPEAKD